MRRSVLGLIGVAALSGCSCDDGTDVTPDAGAVEDAGPDGGDGGGVGDFTFIVESTEASEAIVEVTSGRDGSIVARRVVAVGEDVTIPALADGRYGVLAWADLDGDDAWDGAWDGEGEPTARLGVLLPRGRLRIPLRRGMPRAVVDGRPRWAELQADAFALATEHVAAGTAANGFADHYLDEAFSDQIFQWDSCFMTLFARYAGDALPAMGTLDDFYGVQQPDGRGAGSCVSRTPRAASSPTSARASSAGTARSCSDRSGAFRPGRP